MRKICLGLVCILLSMSALAQTGDLGQFIVISKAPKKSRIAIPVFRVKAQSAGNTALGTDLADLLARDLERSGLFEMIPRSSYLRSAQVTPEIEDWGAWTLLNGQALVRGELIEGADGAFELKLKLFDVVTQQNALNKTYKGPKASLRRMAHRFADECLNWLTGSRGSFESRLAFVSNSTGRKEIYFSDSDGFNPLPLTATKKINLHPAWLDRTRLYFVGYDRMNPDLYLMDLTTKQKVLVSSKTGLNMSPAAGPAGKKLAFAMESPGNNLDLYVANPDGSKPLRLTSNPANDLEPAWSPDGHYLAFVSDRTGSPQVYMIDMYAGAEADGNRPIRLTTSGDYNSSPSWSPDGRYLAYCRRIGGQFDLFLIDFSSPDKRSEVQFTSTRYNEEDPAWGSDSRLLVYSANPRGNYDIYMISIYRKEPVQITDWSSDETQPAWSPNLFEEGG